MGDIPYANGVDNSCVSRNHTRSCLRKNVSGSSSTKKEENYDKHKEKLPEPIKFRS